MNQCGQIQFAIKGIPHGKIEFKARAITKFNPKTFQNIATATTYKDARQKQAEEYYIKSMLALNLAPIPGPVVLGAKFYFPIPESFSRKKKEAAIAQELRHSVKPDLSNLFKHLEDCITKAGLWEDDARVVEYLPGTGKYYSTIPRTEVCIIYSGASILNGLMNYES